MNDLAAFRALEHELSLAPDSIRPTRFSEVPCHFIGGNRAPYWLSHRAQSIKDSDAPRARYYDEATTIGDWRIDNKYKILFSEDTIARIKDTQAYARLSNALNYDRDILPG